MGESCPLQLMLQIFSRGQILGGLIIVGVACPRKLIPEEHSAFTVDT